MTVRGVISAGDPQTADAGAAVLRAGGNAVDAVCGAAFAAFVAEAPLTSPAGAGAMLFGDRDSGFSVLDFFAATPGLDAPARPPDLDFHAVHVDFGPTVQEFHIGRGSVAVPGALAGLLEAHRVAGSLPLRELTAPAIDLARNGYVLSDPIHWVFHLLEPILTHTAGVRAIFCDGDALPQPGCRLANPALADFLGVLSRDADDALRGPFTDAMLRAFGREHGGLLTRADFEAYRPVRRAPLRVPFGGHEVLTNPPPSSGGGLIAFGLRLADHIDLGALPFLGADHLTTVANVMRLVSQARDAGYDQSVSVPDQTVRDFLSDEAQGRWRPRLVALQAERALGSTTHISVLDAKGGAASLTTSNGEGCGHALDELGISVNNFLGEEDINPHGFHAFDPGTWMTTMMAPTVVLRSGDPVLALGSGGSNRIRSAVLCALLNELAMHRPIDESVNAPRMHVEGDHLWYEAEGVDPTACTALEAKWPGATRFDRKSMFFGGVHAAAREDGQLLGGGDRRRGGTVRIAAT